MSAMAGKRTLVQHGSHWSAGPAPHFHLSVSTLGVRRLTTQLYISGEPLNETDNWLHMVADPAQRAALIRPIEDGSAIERNAKLLRYDIVIIA